MHLADASIAHQLTGAAEVRIGTLLAAGLEHAPIFFDRVAHGAAFRDRERERFLTVDVFAYLAGLDDGKGVPVIGRGDLHRIYVGASQQIAEVLVGSAGFGRAGGYLLRIFLVHQPAGRFASAEGVVPVARAFPVHVAHGHHLHALVFEELAQVADALVARADHAQRDPIAGRDLAVKPESRGRDNGGKAVRRRVLRRRCVQYHVA